MESRASATPPKKVPKMELLKSRNRSTLPPGLAPSKKQPKIEEKEGEEESAPAAEDTPAAEAAPPTEGAPEAVVEATAAPKVAATASKSVSCRCRRTPAT